MSDSVHELESSARAVFPIVSKQELSRACERGSAPFSVVQKVSVTSHRLPHRCPRLRITRVKTLHNPYTLNYSEKRLTRFLGKLNTLIESIERDYYLDRDRFQLLLESHWLHTNATGGMLVLPSWELYIFSALQSPSVMADTETYEALQAVAAELRHS
jgi:hypothetical protein